MSSRLLRVGLTGGIATGKSYCLDRFARLGAKTIDADVLARDAVAVGSAGLAAIARRFGSSVLRPDGELDRATLGHIVFKDEHARRDLEAIIHPQVYRAIEDWLGKLSETAGPGVVAIADIPLLYETNRDGDFDVVVVAACPQGTQLERLAARGMARDEAERRVRAQLPIDEKVKRADYVIDTSGTFEATDEQIDRVWTELKTLAAAPR